jgi:hypothetical protein
VYLPTKLRFFFIPAIILQFLFASFLKIFSRKTLEKSAETFGGMEFI